MAEVKIVDKILMVESTIDRSGLKIYDAREKPFKIYGVMLPDEAEDKFKRLPLKVAESVNAGVVFHHANTSGGKIRFKTNSCNLCYKAKLS
ncbi:MAG: SGNH/GDSL hydrolase N-terminal domain-containing protein [Monoglobales bacterium]